MPATELILHPGEVLRTMRDGFTRRVLVVRGRLQRAQKIYKNGQYHRLLGEQGESLTLLAPPALEARLPQQDGYLVTVRGYLDYSLADSRIQPILNLSEVLASELPPPADPRLELLERIVRKERQDVRTLLRRRLLAGEKLRLLLVYARESIVDHDLERALGAQRAAYQIEEVRLVFNPEALAEYLEQADTCGYTAIALVRGGGSGLEVFDHPRLVEQALRMQTPLIAAIGHAKDDTLLARAADWRLETPSLLGTALRDLAEGRGDVVYVDRTPAKVARVLWLWQLAALGLLGLLVWRWFFYAP
jgi:hypothetical protein